MAIVTALMALLLMTGLGLALMSSTSTEVAMSGNYRRNENAFFAADAGVGLAREALRTELNNKILADAATAAAGITLAPATAFTTTQTDQLKGILTNSNLFLASGVPITNALADVNARKDSNALNGNGTFSVQYTLSADGTPTVVPRSPGTINGSFWVGPPPQAIRMRYNYEIVSTGTNDVTNSNPLRAQARARERGFINVTLNVGIDGGTTTYTRAFSQYGAFFHRFSGTLANGTFRGPFHTNQRLGISSSGSVTLRDAVTQSGGNTYNYGSGTKTVNNTDWPGVDFQSSFTTVPAVPLPNNSYSQAYAVLNKTGSSGATALPTTVELTTNLRGAGNVAPTVSGSAIANGVYVPSSDNNSITGGGIYVQGNAEVELSVNGGGAQVYKITQGTQTTEITVAGTDATGSTTVVRRNNGVQTSTENYTGVPMDASDPTLPPKQGVSLYVNGAITSLHGPAGVGTGSARTTAPAIAGVTRVTVTAATDITITGDLKYQDPTVDATTGDPVTNYNQKINILGVFTNNGRVNLAPSSTYTTQNLSLTLDAAIATFNETALTADSSQNTGGILYTGGSLNSSSRLLLRGSRIQSKILVIGYGSTGTGRRDVFFDERFRDGAVAPPFFPTTTLSNPAVPFTLSLGTSNVSATSNTWQRQSN